MRLSLLISTALLFGSAVGTALAQMPRQPVQDVFPDSSFEEIQQAIDTGGTVYFHRLTKQTNDYGEYNQIASSTPDIPAPSMVAVRDKGFFIGKYGNDVDIIGVLGPDGERPRINGGTIPFRVGAFSRMGILGLPVNFRIENLEIFNPDMADGPLAYSRIGVMVATTIGAQSTINNCKFTIKGKESDPGHAASFNVAVWYYLTTAFPPGPPSGARIDIANNTIIGSKIHEGVVVQNFWPETPGVAPPRVFVNNNSLNLMNLRGVPNGRGIDGATLAMAINVSGNLSGSIVTNNVITGDGRSPGFAPPVESVAIRVGSATTGDHTANVTVVGNDSSSFASDFQLWMDSIVSSSTVARNSFGPGDLAGARCGGSENWFVANHFFGAYPGWEPPAHGPGLFWFTDRSQGNVVQATKLNQPPSALDICGQVRDESGGANTVRGGQRCRER